MCPHLFRAAFVSLAVLVAVAESPGASVVLSPDVSTIGRGGTIHFTVTVTPSTYVDRVLLSYQGETGQDVDTTAPYQFSHAFPDTGLDIAVTATVVYNNNDPDDTDTVYVNVIDLVMIGNPAPMRGWLATYIAESDPPGQLVEEATWKYEWNGGFNTYNDHEPDDYEFSYWNGRMIVPGTISCSALIGGVAVEAQMVINPAARLWPIPITCVEDNESTWGSPPIPDATLGQNRDRDSDTSYVFVPRSGPASWDPAFTVSQVTTGPCQGWYYVSSSSLRCQRETVINRYIKWNGPTFGGINWYDRNDQAGCFTTVSADFVLAVMNHEYRGTPPVAGSLGGHQGRFEYAILVGGYDPKQRIEALAHRTSSLLLRTLVNDAINADEQAVKSFGEDETYMTTYGPNWSAFNYDSLGAGPNSRWDPDSSSWTACIHGPENF